MRQIHQLTQVIARVVAAVVGLKGSGQTQQAMEISNKALNEQLDLDLDVLLEMDADEMIEALKSKDAVNDENLESIADLFYELAKTLSEDGEQENEVRLLFKRSLQIYRHIESTGNIYSIDRNHKISEIEKWLQES